MNFITIQDIPKLGKKIGKKLTKKDIQRLNEKKEKNTTMKKYKDKREHRLQAEHIHPHSLINRK
jgi:hypothetical protein